MVYRKVASPSITRFPWLACRLHTRNQRLIAHTITIIKTLHLQEKEQSAQNPAEVTTPPREKLQALLISAIRSDRTE